MGKQSSNLVMNLGVLVLLALSGNVAGHWGYEGEGGPDHWAETSPECAGSSQSPIDVKTGDAKFDADLKDFDIIPEITEDTATTIVNNGHTMVMTTSAQVLVSGGGFPETYKVAQAHMHWGSNNKVGSEHTVDATAFPMEMHIVTYNFEKYSSVVEAEGLGPVLGSGDASGLAVLGIFFSLSANDNPQLEPLLAHMDAIHAAGSNPGTISDFHMWDLLPSSTRNFYRYSGSLTTPTCNEVVAWTLFEEKNTISEAQLNRLRSLHDDYDAPLQDNYRPVMPMNGRTLTASFKTPSYDVDDDDTSIEDLDGGAAQTTVTVLLPSLLLSVLYRFM